MKTLLTAVCLCAVASSIFAAPFSDLSFEAASKEAGRTGRIVLVDFYTTWCGPCKMLDKDTWTDAAVIRLLEQKTVALRIDAEKEAALSKRYKIEAYPSVLLIKPDGTEFDRLVGYRDPKQFMADFNAALAGKDSVSRARDAVMVAAGTNVPFARMQFGMALAEKSRNAEALAEYLWCFDHGLEAGPAFANLRLGFLLTNLKKLAAHYPPAGKALKARCDERQAKIAAGVADLPTIQELKSLIINADQKVNFAAFDRLPSANQGRDTLLELFADQFLEAKRYADVLQGTDGKSAFKQAVDRSKIMLQSVGTNNPVMEESIHRLTLNKGAHAFEALAGLKRNQDGKELAGQILKFDSSPATRTLLVEAAQRAGNAELAGYVKE
jgi:thiol-disulfide isomerase/thioredoxin